MNSIPIVTTPPQLMRVIGRATRDLFEIAVAPNSALDYESIEFCTDLTHIVSRETARRWKGFPRTHVAGDLYRTPRSYRGYKICLLTLQFVGVPVELQSAFNMNDLHARRFGGLAIYELEEDDYWIGRSFGECEDAAIATFGEMLSRDAVAREVPYGELLRMTFRDEDAGVDRTFWEQFQREVAAGGPFPRHFAGEAF